MMSEYVLSLADSQAVLATVGGKGASLARLSAAGLPVPGGFHVTTAAYQRFVTANHLQSEILALLEAVDVSRPATLETASQGISECFRLGQIPLDIADVITRSYADLSDTEPVVAVRSSATAEDLPELSFAGQQETYLNIQGVAALLEAVKRCWASLWTARAIGYRTRNSIDQNAVRLAVVVQRLINAESSGILFTANPINGNRQEMVINAAWGLGEAIVGGLVTPDTLTVDKSTGQVLSSQTADKQVMTVRINGGTEEQPVPEALRYASVLDDETAVKLVHLGTKIENLFNIPSDIEWAWAEGQFYILQARPITVLPEEAEKASPTEWPLPDPNGKYMRTSIIDILPDPLSPLFATMGLVAINRAIKRWLDELCRAADALPDENFVTINGYAYYSTTFTKKQWWLLLTRLVPAFPKMLRTGVTVWREVAHPRYAETVMRWRDRPLDELTVAELLKGSHEIVEAASDHLLSLMASTMGPSAGSEMLFTQVYERLIKRPQDPAAPIYLMGFDSIPIRSEKSLFDLAQWCRERQSLVTVLMSMSAEQLAAQLRSDQTPPDVPIEVWQEWKTHISDYLGHYGYSIYTLDFAHPLPLDDPLPMLEALKLFIAGQARNPHERQQASAEQRECAVRAVLERLWGPKRWLFRKTLKWAQSQAPLREDGIAEIGLGYPLLRQMLHELGRRLVEANVIAEADDIFWLTQAEVEQAAGLDRNETISPLTEQVRLRKAEWRVCKQVTPPPMLPPAKKYLGVNVEMFIAVDEGNGSGNVVRGIGTSPGRVTATARVLLGPEDFSKMQVGDILIAPITTPAWTPLFTMAAGVVTDVGGPLSHGSIVAREYGIPAVMGTGTATKRIRSGQIVTVDGSQGMILLSDGEVEPMPDNDDQLPVAVTGSERDS